MMIFVKNTQKSAKLERDAEEFCGILGGDASHFFGGVAVQLSQHIDGVTHQGRVVALAAMGVGREIRGVGFDHEILRRNAGGDLLHPLGVFEGDDAGEGDHPAAAPQFTRHFDAAAKAVEDAAHVGMA